MEGGCLKNIAPPKKSLFFHIIDYTLRSKPINNRQIKIPGETIE